MDLTEESMCYLEEHIPELADSAFKQAYWHALASGNIVLKLEDNVIFEISSDGSKREIKRLPPQIEVTPGQKFKIQ